MADNVTLNSGTGGDIVAADEISGVKHQRVKIQYGADGSATDVSTTSPIPVDAAATQTKLDTLIAAVDGLEGFTDGLEAKLDTLHTDVDGLEGKDYATQTTLAAVLAAVDQLEGYLDGVETLLAAATPAGNNNIGDVDVASGPTVASVTQSAHTTSATPGTTTDVLASDATRKGLSIVNTSDTDITLHLGSGAGTAGTGVVLKAGGGVWDGLLGLCIYTGQIRSVCAAASKTLAVVTA